MAKTGGAFSGRTTKGKGGKKRGEHRGNFPLKGRNTQRGGKVCFLPEKGGSKNQQKGKEERKDTPGGFMSEAKAEKTLDKGKRMKHHRWGKSFESHGKG